MSATLNILLIGNENHAEFRGPVAFLAEGNRLECATSMEEAIKSLDGADNPPDVLVLAQTYPGEFAEEEIDRLRRASPLSRIAALLGSWCEGELRTGRPTAGVLRYYWHHFVSRMRPNFESLRAGQCPPWGLPLTASDDERLLFADESEKGEGRGARDEKVTAGLMLVYTRQSILYEMLAKMGRERGYSSLWMRDESETFVEGPSLVLFETPEVDDEAESALKRIKKRFSGVPVYVLTDFPRGQDEERAQNAGAERIISKPFTADDFV